MLTLAVIVGCGKDENERHVLDASEGGSEKVFRLLKEMPAWTSLNYHDSLEHTEEDTKTRKRIEDVIGKISCFSLDEIRAGIEEYTEAVDYPAAKIFVLNRFLFELPMEMPLDSVHPRLRGAWIGMPITKNGLSLIWPWSVDESGEYRLTGTFEGYAGPTYLPLESFDYLKQNFSKRKNACKKTVNK